PTAALSQREVERLFLVIQQLRTRQVAMMFVSHRMEEIYRLSDRVTVLRDGHHVATEPVSSMSRDRAVQLMVGRSLSGMYPAKDPQPGEILFEVSALGLGDVFANVSFVVRTGEILGLGGLVGSGRTEIARVIFGIDQPPQGAMRLAGTPISFHSPSEAMAAGIAYLSEDR